MACKYVNLNRSLLGGNFFYTGFTIKFLKVICIDVDLIFLVDVLNKKKIKILIKINSNQMNTFLNNFQKKLKATIYV